MVTTSSKNGSFVCLQDVCDDQTINCAECHSNTNENIQPLKKYLRELWINIQLFFETDKWEHDVTLKVGDSQYLMKMDDIEARWRNPQR